MDPKSELNQFVQRLIQRPVVKEDVVYTTTKYGRQFQCIVKLNCLSGLPEYAGELGSDQKEAEKLAARQALDAYKDFDGTPALDVSSATKKRKASLAALGFGEQGPAKVAALDPTTQAPVDNPAVTPKTKLNDICGKIKKGGMQKGDTLYECMKVTGGFQATIKLPCLPGEWAERVWAGVVHSTKQKAEQSAAEMALQHLESSGLIEEAFAQREEERLAKVALTAAKKGNFGKGRGKGKGKGGKSERPMWPSWDFSNQWMMEAMMWNAPDFGPPQVTPFWGGGGKDYGKGYNDAKPRERILEGQTLTGVVLEWKGQSGWITPHIPIEHPAAQKRRGDLKVLRKDLVDGLESLEEQQQVMFFVYEESLGLGAEEVTLL